ncbi:MAG: zinc metalloprotease HtpX [candidate division WOR-3 bacterium]
MSATTFYDLIRKNKLKTYLFVFVITILLAVIGYVLIQVFNWGISGYIFFAFFIIFYNLILYYNADKLALSLSGAKPASVDKYYQLHNVVEEVAIAAGVPKPKVYIIEDPSPNAFATGRNPNNSAIAVTTGLLNMMNRNELQGVIAHEMAHIRNYDVLLMTIVAIVGGLIVLFRDLFFRYLFFFGGGRRDDRRRGEGNFIFLIIAIVLAIIAPILVFLIRAAISREREYLADATGAEIIRDPEALASALEKIAKTNLKLKTASEATAHLFITNPFLKDRLNIEELFATHPPIHKRIARLRQLTI